VVALGQTQETLEHSKTLCASPIQQGNLVEIAVTPVGTIVAAVKIRPAVGQEALVEAGK
jgi:ribosomal protein L2